MKRRLLSVALVFCCVIGTMTPVPAFGAVSASPNEAYAILSDTISSFNFKDIAPGTDKVPDKGVRGGEECWIMSNRLGGDRLAYINFNLEDEFAYKVNTGDVFEIEVDYFDQEKGYFYLDYDSQFKPMQYTDITYLQNEGVWKTVKYTIDDAYFGGRVDGGYDFRLVIKPWQSTVAMSPGPVAVKAVRVKKIPGVNKIWTTASTDVSGNSFRWFDEEKVVHNTLKNLTDQTVEAEVTFSAVSSGGYKEFTFTETMTFTPFEEKTKDVNLDIDRCDLYDWEVTVQAETPKINSKMQRLQFAILKTDPDGIRNEHAYLSNHLERYYKDYPGAIEEGVDLISKSNVYGIRGSGFWLGMEPQPGIYQWDGVEEVLVADEARKKGMEVMWQVNAGHFFHTGNWSDLVRTEAEFEAYGKFLEFFVDKVKDYTTDYEIANELDLPQFNTRGLSTEELTKLIHFAADIIKRKDPGARVHAWGFTWIKGEKDWEMFTEAVERGTLDDLAFVSYHPYDNLEVVEKNGISDSAKKYLDYIRERNPEVGLSITEVGNSVTDTETVYDERNLGSNMTRMGIHFLSREVADVLVYYNFDRKGITTASAREDGFGMVQVPLTRASDDSGKAMTPFESYVAFTAMNYLMAQSTPAGVYDLDDNIKISAVNSKKFGGKVLALNTVTKPSVVSLQLGCKSIRQFDDFGNEKVVYSDSGIYTFCLDDRLTYVAGDVQSVEAVENPAVSVDTAETYIVEDDFVTIGAKGDATKIYDFDMKIPVNCELVSGDHVENGTGEVKVHLLEKRRDYMFMDATLTDRETGRLAMWGQIRMNVPTPITSSLDLGLVSDDDVNQWKGVFDVTNNSQSKAVRGYIKINAPEIFTSLKKVDIGIIPPGKTAQISVNLPLLYRKQQYSIDYDVVTEEFDGENFRMTKDLTVATGAKGKIVIDGKIGKDEWNQYSFMYADTQEQIGNITDWKGVKDLSFKAAVAYDEEYMYLCADVTDDKFFQDQTGKTKWQGDSIQLGVFYGEEGHTALGDRSTTFHELCVALTPNGPEIYRHLSQDNVYPAGDFEGGEAAVVREGTHTYYEMKVPWKNLLLEGQQPKQGDSLGFAMLANDNDGSGRRGWIHYAGGIAPSKTTRLFTYLYLTK